MNFPRGKTYLKEFKPLEELDPMENPAEYGMQQLMMNLVGNFLPMTLDLDISAKKLGVQLAVSAEVGIDPQGVFIVIEG